MMPAHSCCLTIVSDKFNKRFAVLNRNAQIVNQGAVATRERHLSVKSFYPFSAVNVFVFAHLKALPFREIKLRKDARQFPRKRPPDKLILGIVAP